VKLAIKYRDRGVVAIDLAGDETHFGATLHAHAYDMARDAGLHRTVHAGEAGPAANIAEALDLLHAERIGHGYHLVDDEALYQRVKRERVPLECCLTSSLQTGAVASLEQHPVRRFMADGLEVTLSTDDPGVSGIDLEHEYRVAIEQLGFSAAELARVTFSAVNAAFLPAAEKAALRKELQREFMAMEGGE
jgi:adenosine deaminase